MQKLIVILIASTFIVACGSTEVKNEDSSAADSVIQLTKSKIEQIYVSGIYIVAENKIQTCDGAVYTLLDESGKLADLSKELMLENKYQSNLFVHVKGMIDAEKLVINEVVNAEPKNFRNTCISYEYWCLGNEPFWQVQISKNENLIDFYNPMEQELVHFDYVPAVEMNNTVVYTAKNKKQEIKITLKAQQCSDGMSERAYSHSVSVVLNGNEYKGCAIKFGDKIE